MAEYLSPGVYVEEFDAGIKAMEGVGTSTAGFIGMAQKGPVKGIPVLITSMADYRRRFGGYLSERDYKEMRYLPYAVEQFFNNGGSACYVMRVCREAVMKEDAQGEIKNENNGAVKAAGSLKNAKGMLEEGKQFLAMTAADPGAWGNRIQAFFTLLPKSRTKAEKAQGPDDKSVYTLADASGFRKGDMIWLQSSPNADICFSRIAEINDRTITLEWKMEQEDGSPVYLAVAEWNLVIRDDTASEQYEGVSFNPDRNNYVENAVMKSYLVTAGVHADKLASGVLEETVSDRKEPSFAVSFENGDDGAAEFDASLYIGNDGASDERSGLKAFLTLPDVSIMAIPGIVDKGVQSELVSHCERLASRFAVLDMPLAAKEVAELQEFKENVDSGYAAMYHPWLQCYDPLANKNTYFPPSGSVAGIYGRTDNSRGVHKAPANEVVRNCTGLSVRYNEAEQGKLNPKGINLIRSIPGQGIRVWGARTCSSDGNWKYVNVRRLFIFIEESIRANTGWAVFEPNDEMLWSRVEGTIRVFLTAQWRNGALAGNTADEAFFINIGKSTMTEDDILNGRLICVIGVAPVRPAEFVVFRITQKMEGAQ